MNKSFVPVAILVLGILISLGIVFGQGVLAQGFGFEKNIDVRKNADAESVAGCMQSCEDMVAGWLVMNPDSPNYARQGEKIEAKAQQCLGMNELAGSPFTEAEILASCGLEPGSGPECVAVTSEEVHSGACGTLSLIGELNLPQCCSLEGGPSGDLLCGTGGEWVVGVAAFPVCYIPGS